METERDRLFATSISNLAEAINKQVDAIGSLTDAIRQLSNIASTHESSPLAKPLPSNSKLRKWWYRAWSDKSRGKIDEHGNMHSGNPKWVLSCRTDIALHFAEFHSDDCNRKDTALISVTSDPIRALKKAFMEWHCGNFGTRDQTKIFISIFHSSEYYDARELVEMARMPPLCLRLSKETCDRLNSPKLEHLHDSEAVFLHVIPKEDLVVNISLRDLFARGLEEILPELCHEDTTYNNILSPKGIRAKIDFNNESDFRKTTTQLIRMYCMFTQDGSENTIRSLTNARELLLGDPFSSGAVKQEGSRILQNEIEMIEMIERPPIRLNLRQKSTIPDESV